MICQNCMSEIDDRATFCPKCGKKIELNSVDNKSVKEPEDNSFVSFDVKKHKKLLFSVLFLLFSNSFYRNIFCYKKGE